MRELITLRVNGESREIAVLPHHTLLEVLREDLGLIGTKHGCELYEIGTLPRFELKAKKVIDHRPRI
jgi:carbon-monoxide dehydrogenase small subunit